MTKDAAGLVREDKMGLGREGVGACQLHTVVILCSMQVADRAAQKHRRQCLGRAVAPGRRTAHLPTWGAVIRRRFVSQRGPSKRPPGLCQSPWLPEGCMCHRAGCMAIPPPCSKDHSKLDSTHTTASLTTHNLDNSRITVTMMFTLTLTLMSTALLRLNP